MCGGGAIRVEVAVVPLQAGLDVVAALTRGPARRGAGEGVAGDQVWHTCEHR